MTVKDCKIINKIKTRKYVT